MERVIERIIAVSRWALVPCHPGLVLALGTMFVAFPREVWPAVSNAATSGEHQAIVKVLPMVDLTLMAGLVVAVPFSGDANLVSRIDQAGARSWPAWMTQVDLGGLKKKLFAASSKHFRG